jgi:hypothetical protein
MRNSHVEQNAEPTGANFKWFASVGMRDELGYMGKKPCK